MVDQKLLLGRVWVVGCLCILQSLGVRDYQRILEHEGVVSYPKGAVTDQLKLEAMEEVAARRWADAQILADGHRPFVGLLLGFAG